MGGRYDISWTLLLQGYHFSGDNPYRDWPNAFAVAQEKARDGDLNATVLLLEAAILQDPQDSEVSHLERMRETPGPSQPRVSRLNV